MAFDILADIWEAKLCLIRGYATMLELRFWYLFNICSEVVFQTGAQPVSKLQVFLKCVMHAEIVQTIISFFAGLNCWKSVILLFCADCRPCAETYWDSQLVPVYDSD